MPTSAPPLPPSVAAPACPDAARHAPLPRLALHRQKLQQALHGSACTHAERRTLIENVLQRHNTLAILPQDCYRILCRELPQLPMDGTIIVVSSRTPLAGQSGDGHCLFLAPEHLADDALLARLSQRPIGLFVIDEAACLSRAGNAFHPSYLALHAAVDTLGSPPILALTTSTTPSVLQDIEKELGIADLRIVNASMYRQNLHLEAIHVASEAEKLGSLLRLLRVSPGSGIIYVATIKAVEHLEQQLLAAGESASSLHGHQLSSIERKQRLERFLRGESRILIATHAYEANSGRPDIRFVVHYHMPANLDSYYREIELAGHDRETAACKLLYSPQDKRIQQFFLARRYPEREELRAVHGVIQNLDGSAASLTFHRIHEELPQISSSKLHLALQLLTASSFIRQEKNLTYHLQKMHVRVKQLSSLTRAYQEKSRLDRLALERMAFYAQTGFCRWKMMLEYFGEHVEWEHCGNCDNCRSPTHPPLQASPPRHRQPRPVVLAGGRRACHVPGSAVRVARFGEGRVVAVAGEKITIVFPNSQTRTFLASYVQQA